MDGLSDLHAFTLFPYNARELQHTRWYVRLHGVTRPNRRDVFARLEAHS